MPFAAGIHYTDTGRGDVIALVPGLSMWSDFWDPVRPRLAAEYRVLTPDLPGCGQSLAVGGDVAAMAHRLAAWHHALGLPTIHWVGNSLGCQVLLHVAAGHPERVRTLTLAGPTLPVAYRVASLPRVAWCLAHEPWPMWRNMWRGVTHTGPLRRLRLARRAAQDDPYALLPRIQCPVLVMQGSRDTVVPVAATVALSERLPQATFVPIQGAGHTIIYREPDQFLAALRTFLQFAALTEPRPSSWRPRSTSPT